MSLLSSSPAALVEWVKKRLSPERPGCDCLQNNSRKVTEHPWERPGSCPPRAYHADLQRKPHPGRNA